MASLWCDDVNISLRAVVYLGLAIQGAGACVDLTDGVSVGRPHGPKNLLEPGDQLGFLRQTHLLQLFGQHLE